MASLQARHTRTCALGRPWTTFEDARTGCTCRPAYVAVIYQGGKTHREKLGTDRREAERAFKRFDVAADLGEYRPIPNVTFEAWADEWHGSLRRPKANTLRSYGFTIKYAKSALGTKPVRQLNVADVSGFLRVLSEAGVGASTQRKHLRVLGACLRQAVRQGYAARNPVDELHESQRPQTDRRESAYFTDDELPRLIAALPEGVYRNLALVAVKTGARQGELLAATWGDLNLGTGTLHIRRSYTDGDLGTTKNRRTRHVELGPSVIELLGAWWGECGHPRDNVLVFPGETKTGYINPQVLLRRELYPAMTRAGIPRVGPTGEKRTWHSFRHSFARVALENGRQITWLSRHLGHSSLAVTEGVYGHWSQEAARAEVHELEGAFNV